MRVLVVLLAFLLAADLNAASFKELRDMVGSKETITLAQGTEIEGIIVSDYKSHNMETPVQVSHKAVDLGLNFRTAYV
jgi:hypothetical protein